MRTVPAAAAATFCGADQAARTALGAHLRRVGERVEVDLDTLSGAGDAPAGLAEALSSWWGECEDLWLRAALGDLDGAAWVRTRRRAVEAKQSTAKGAKSDLAAEFDALVEAGPFADVVTEATAIRPAAAMVKAMAGALGGSFSYVEATHQGTLVLPMTGQLLWPDVLGGPVWVGEIARTLTLELRYAAWRDRRVRRLAGVAVDIEEMWAPTPA